MDIAGVNVVVLTNFSWRFATYLVFHHVIVIYPDQFIWFFKQQQLELRRCPKLGDCNLLLVIAPGHLLTLVSLRDP